MKKLLFLIISFTLATSSFTYAGVLNNLFKSEEQKEIDNLKDYLSKLITIYDITDDQKNNIIKCAENYSRYSSSHAKDMALKDAVKKLQSYLPIPGYAQLDPVSGLALISSGKKDYLLKGTIKNLSNKSYSDVQAFFNLFNSQGQVTGSAWAFCNYLPPSQEWAFSAVPSSQDFSYSSLNDLTVK